MTLSAAVLREGESALLSPRRGSSGAGFFFDSDNANDDEELFFWRFSPSLMFVLDKRSQ
jgi:hypothetical protein